MYMLDDQFGKDAYLSKLNQAQNLHQHIKPSRVIKARVAQYEEQYQQRRQLEARHSLGSKPRLKHKLASWLKTLAEKLEPTPQPLRHKRSQS